MSGVDETLEVIGGAKVRIYVVVILGPITYMKGLMKGIGQVKPSNAPW